MPGTRLRTLLTLLVVAGGSTVTPDRLADDLWGDDVPAGATNALQSLVSKLRRTLGGGTDLLVTEPLGYRLAVEAGAVDARGFERELAEGQAALAADDAGAASAAVRCAPPLARSALDGSPTTARCARRRSAWRSCASPRSRTGARRSSGVVATSS